MTQPHTPEKTPYIQCIYASAATTPFDDSELVTLLAAARENNKSLNITGMLLYHDHSFFQILEGEEEQVDRLFKRISGDSRHSQVVKLITEPVEERHFENWSMGYANIGSEEISEIPGLNDFFTSRQCFTQLEPCRARTLLKQFRSGSWRQRLDD